MKKVWKWILGIVIALIVVAALVGGFVMMRNYRMTTIAQRYRQFSQQVPNGTPAPKAPNGQTTPNVPANPSVPNRPMMGRGFGYGYGPMMNGRGPMMGRGFNRSGASSRSGALGMGIMFMGLVSLILLIAVVAGVAFVFYQLGKNAGIAATLLAQQASNTVAATDTDPPARASRARKTG